MTNEELRKIANDLKFNRGCIHSNPKLMIEESFISGYKYALENQWVSVKDRLPKLDRNGYCDDLLIYCSDRYLGVSHFSNKEFINPEGFDVIGNVKYWMPIPKLNINDSKAL